MRRLDELRLPTVTDTRWSSSDDLGALIAYGPPPAVLRRQAVDYIYRILNGAKAAELPIQQPSKFDLIVNLRTARKIGLTVPNSMLLRADQVVE